jgi:hypothetical protein
VKGAELEETVLVTVMARLSEHSGSAELFEHAAVPRTVRSERDDYVWRFLLTCARP